MEKRQLRDSLTEQSYMIMHRHINGDGRLFGGQLLAWIDEIAGICALRYAGTPVTTAAIDNLQFRQPVFLGEMVVLVGRVTYVGHSSMEVRVDSFVESREGRRTLINRAFLVMVSTDEHGKPQEVPRLVLDDDMQKAEWESGKKRSELRKMRRIEGY